MEESLTLAALSEHERAQAFARFQMLQPYLEEQVPLSAVTRRHNISLRTFQRWVRRYRPHYNNSGD